MPKLIDMTGQKYGTLTITGKSIESDNFGNPYWNFICDCGKTGKRTRACFLGSKSPNCGCREDIAGKKFGMLLVIERSEEFSKNGVKKWKCICDCGKTTNQSNSGIKSGYVKSCGCIRYYRNEQILTGQKFGHLTIIGMSDKDKKNQWNCFCKCDCGNKEILKIACCRLINKCIISCGCSAQRDRAKRANWTGYEEINGTIFKDIKNRAVHRKLEFTITIEYIWNLFLKQNRKCVYTGLEIDFPKKIKERNLATASLDRIDSSKGYIEGNVQWVHKIVNVMKMDLTEKEFLSFCKLIYENRKLNAN